MSIETLALALFFVVAGGAAVWFLRRRAATEKEHAEALELAQTEGRGVPQTLHPVVDLDRCMGSLSCLSVCPEGDVMGVVNGKAALINPAACIGHGKCALECPVDAITLVFGTSTRGVDLPEVNEQFETSRAGVHIVGELGGMGLIKNAITQGLQVAEHLGVELGATSSLSLRRRKKGGIADVIVIGAGPSGLATALGLKKRGVYSRILEQESVGGTIAHYPRQKVVMTEKVELPYYGTFGKALISKEELLESWNVAIHKAGLAIETGMKVERIDGSDGAFSVVTPQGTVEGKKVVLAVGRRGTPRKLGVPGEDLEKVTYRLIDARQYEGQRVLVVGGGDAALEAAIQLAEETDAEVALSYRQAELGKAREANKRRFRELVAEGRIFAFMPSTVKGVTPGAVKLEIDKKPLSLPNDFVVACLGGEVPAEFLKKNGIELVRLHGEQLGGKAKAARGSAAREEAEQGDKRLSRALLIVGAILVVLLALVGRDYYLLSKLARLQHPAHAFLKPSGPWGHGVGIVATLFMMSNFIYALRKRWRRLKGFSSIRRWLTFHQFVGFMSPLIIAFHAAFQSNNFLASATATGLGIVVLTGVIGRFIYSWVPAGGDQKSELGDLTSRWERLRQRVRKEVATYPNAMQIAHVLAQAAEPLKERSLPAFLAHVPFIYLQDQRRLGEVEDSFPTHEHFLEFRDGFKRMRHLQIQVSLFTGLKRIMSVWRALHVVLAVLLVVLIAGHIGVSLFLGYKWIFS